MKKKTVYEVALGVLEKMGKPLSIKEIYDYIVLHDLYKFNAESPEDIVRVSVRSRSEGLDFPSARRTKYFQFLKNGTFWIKDIPIPGQTIREKKKDSISKQTKESLKHTVDDLKSIHSKHVEAFKAQILNQLMQIDPALFEVFARELLRVYGFKKVEVTNYVKDGGIDGFGQLKVGITHLNVAFQCKRWKNNSVSRTEIDKFRGAIQGDFEQGIIFTTSKFTKEALGATRKAGAVPIILIDGKSLVEIMIDKKFGIETETIPVYINALDNIFNNE
ncbi:restriction system protein [Pustulibacterium marinum]|uniref:Restriction system protein n=1 Tax=Pustulibacterium marinum TaxID=1224947 RepID=A0A1I7IRD1_9FLAO|nr:restriction endonuclease [Pustulibacterium marinum]SFU75500.1 restriction system protein [Pustulibacterium marinum]